MPIITLTSDWNPNDFYVGMIKGKILSTTPGAVIVDISHQIPFFNITQAAFVIRNSYFHFPAGSIHLICMNTEPEADQKILAIKYDGHYFIGTDNGIFGLLFKTEPEIITEIQAENPEYEGIINTFVKTAGSLLAGADIANLGKPAERYQKQIPLRAVIEESVINGSVIYIDSYQNAFTNITRELFNRIGMGRHFEILLASNYYRIDKIHWRYSDVPAGEIVLLFNSLDLLEIAINKGHALALLNLSLGSVIRVKFYDNRKMTAKNKAI